MDCHIKDLNQYLTFDKLRIIRNQAEITFKKLDLVEIDDSIEEKTEGDEFLSKDFKHVSQSPDTDYAFIAMPIDPDNKDLEDVLDSIKEACRRCGVNAERVDEPPSNERITDRILESIRRAEFVIVDLTNSKPNVFYEAGYAQGQGKTPIYVARAGTPLEFDLKDYPIIFFKNMKQLKDGLEHRLRGLRVRDETPNQRIVAT